MLKNLQNSWRFIDLNTYIKKKEVWRIFYNIALISLHWYEVCRTLIVFVSVNQQDRQRTYKIEALFRKHFYLRITISIIYYECVFVAQGIQNPMSMHHVIICGLSGPTILFHILSETARFSKEDVEHRMSQELRSPRRDLIPELILSRKLHIHLGPIRNGSGVMNF